MSCLPARPELSPTASDYGEDTTIVTSKRRIVIGGDTHLDTIHVAAITDTGQLLGDAEFRTNPTGYWAAIKCRQIPTALTRTFLARAACA
jgi:hypothetical protein